MDKEDGRFISRTSRKAASLIEDEFARGHEGGTQERFNNICNHVADAIKDALRTASGYLIDLDKKIDEA